MQLNENLKPDLVAWFDTSETELSLDATEKVSSSDNVNAVSGLPSGAGVEGSNLADAIALDDEQVAEEDEQAAEEETVQLK